MEPQQGFGLKHVSLTRGSRSYGFVIRQCTERAPTMKDGLDHLQMYFVGDVIAGGSAEKTDMDTGDRIVSINGTSITGLDNDAVLDIVKRSTKLNLLLIPSGESGFSFLHSAYRKQLLGHHPKPALADKLERRRGYASQHRLHSILEHGELAYSRPERYRSSMVIGAQLPTHGFYHIMETNGCTADVSDSPRKLSVGSDSSEASASCKPVLRRANSETVAKDLKLSLLKSPPIAQDDVTLDDLDDQRQPSRHVTSTSCLPDSFDYSTSAKITDHFPQKVLTPSSSFNSSQLSAKQSESFSLPLTPVASLEDPNSPELNIIDSLDEESVSENISTVEPDSPVVGKKSPVAPRSPQGQESKPAGHENSSSQVRFLPAYRDKTVEEMMQDRSPRAVWQPSTKTVQRSHSTKSSPKMSVPNYNYNGSSPGQQGRIYGTPPHIRPYNTININRPNRMNARINDGTHPRMPMRAMHPPTYHGVPVHTRPVPRYGIPVNYENAYGTTRRTPPYAQAPPPQRINSGRKATSHGDMHNNHGRIYSESSPPSSGRCQVDGRNIRGANSESEIDQARPDHRQYGSGPRGSPAKGSLSVCVPSGVYVASSSMTNIPQQATLMPPSTPPSRSDSAGNVRRPNGLPLDNYGTRHSYSGTYQQPEPSLPSNRINSSDDVFSDSKGGYRRGNVTPTSPVSRQPSYLAAVNAPVRQGYQSRGKNEEPMYFNSNAVLRTPTHQTEEDSCQKIQRRASYLMATSKTPPPIEEGQKTPNQTLRKLKDFFGENTPSIKEGQEKALRSVRSQEPFALPDNLEVQKTGILAVKVLAVAGKKSHSRSWRGMGAVLSRDMLYLVKDKKENATMLTTPSGSLSIDEKPISIVACYVAIAHSYTKKRHVFKLITSTASEYLLQAEDDIDMVDWIKAIEANRHPDKEKSSSPKSEQLTSAELVKRINDQQVKMNQQKKKSLAGRSFKSKQLYTSPSKNNDSSQKKEDKKKRNSSGPSKPTQFAYNADPEPASGDFGIPIQECSPSHENEFVPLIVELCTKAIEDRGLDFVGIYRVPGNKAAVENLKKELNQGIINLDNDKWRDMNVLSSLLKTYFRRLPDSLITTEKYKAFIETNKLPDAKGRLMALKDLIRTLPDYNYETLKYLAIHLQKVADHGETNKMDTRNLAIVFGPTIVRSSEDVMSLVTDMSDQCRIIESLIVYCDWMFDATDSEPPAIEETDISPSCAPISETMNNMSAADLASLANNKKSKSQLKSAFAANKKPSRGSLNASLISSPVANTSPRQSQQAPGDDHGFKNRDLQQEAALRNQRLQSQKERGSREWHASHNAAQATKIESDRLNKQTASPQSDNSLRPRWHSEESVLAEHPPKITHDQYPYHTSHYPGKHMRQMSNIEGGETPPPPLPARGVDTKPPLPPRPNELYHAKPTQIESPQYQEGQLSPARLYNNYEHLQLDVPETVPPMRTLRVIQNPLKSASLTRRGSLDSMMDNLEAYHQYSSSSSTESQEGFDLLSTITETFDHKLKQLAEPNKYPMHERHVTRPKTNSDSSSLGSGRQTAAEPLASSSTMTSGRGSSEQSHESLLSVLSNKENMSACDSFSSIQDMRGSVRSGFDGSTSSLGSVPYRPDAKVGIASRIERKDMKPLAYPPAVNNTQTRVVNATGSVISHRGSGISTNSVDDDGDLANNNSLDYDTSHLIQRHMSDEKKRVRRRHTVGGARDFELFKTMLTEYNTKQNVLNEANPAVEPLQETLSAWQRLQPGGNKEPLSLQHWLEKERFRASSPELEMHDMANIMHLQKMSRKLSGSLLESNT